MSEAALAKVGKNADGLAAEAHEKRVATELNAQIRNSATKPGPISLP